MKKEDNSRRRRSRRRRSDESVEETKAIDSEDEEELDKKKTASLSLKEEEETDDYDKSLVVKNATEEKTWVRHQTPESKYEHMHRVLLGLMLCQVVLWMIGTEAICLFGNGCYLFGGQKQSKLNRLSTLNPGVPENGGAVLVLTALIIVLVLLPIGIYLVRTELRRNVRLWGFLSILTSVYLFVMCAIYFEQAANTSWYQWPYNYGARMYYASMQDADEASKSANMSYGFMFLISGILMSLMAIYACIMGQRLPRYIAHDNEISYQLLGNSSNVVDDDENEEEDLETGRKKKTNKNKKSKKNKNKKENDASEIDDAL